MASRLRAEELSSVQVSESSTADSSAGEDSDSMANPSNKRQRSSDPSHPIQKPKQDPNRQKRRKAKRACGKCQKAHLTCGDERPCSRCIQRGLEDQCEDGDRKLPKYRREPEDSSAETKPEQSEKLAKPSTGQYLSRSQLDVLSAPLPQRDWNQMGNSLPPVAPDVPASLVGQGPSLPGRPVDILPAFNAAGGQISSQYPVYGSASQQTPTLLTDSDQGNLSGDTFGPLDPSYLNDLNFVNRFAAAEFGMLGTMTSGMAKDLASDVGQLDPGRAGARSTRRTSSSPYIQNHGNAPSLAIEQQQNAFARAQWQADVDAGLQADRARRSKSRSQSAQVGEIAGRHEPAPAFAIGASAYPSPSSTSSPQNNSLAFDRVGRSKTTFTNRPPQGHSPNLPGSITSQSPPAPASSTTATSAPLQPGRTYSRTEKAPSLPSRRPPNPTDIYSNITQPFNYTAAFHSLTALIQTRFSPQKTALIAKALASIRPSFISATMRLQQSDLIFMEKELQRALLVLDEHITSMPTPAIICRRTGDVVAVNKEFSLMTGWTKDLLLGKSPNMNVNVGGETSGQTSRAGDTPVAQQQQDKKASTPSEAASSKTEPHPPVNIVELFDDDSVCEFFQDYSRLAFGDSNGTAMTPCKLLRYRTAQDMRLEEGQVELRLKRTGTGEQKKHKNALRKANPEILGGKEGKVQCTIAWSVKRDMFDIPMLFKIAALPWI